MTRLLPILCLLLVGCATGGHRFPAALALQIEVEINRMAAASGWAVPPDWTVRTLPGTRADSPGWAAQLNGQWVCGETHFEKGKRLMTTLVTDPAGNVTGAVIGHEFPQGFDFYRNGETVEHRLPVLLYIEPQNRKWWS